MRKIFKDYKSSLKSSKVEEPINTFLYRPLAHLIVLLTRNTPVTPNQLTVVSFTFSMTSAFLFLFGNIQLGLVFLLLRQFFDCADGQLSRLTKKGTKYGAVLDQITDTIGITSIITAIYLNQLFSTNNILIVPLGLISGVFVTIHIMYYDHFKASYEYYVLTNSDKNREPFTSVPPSSIYTGKKGLAKIFLYLYYNFFIAGMFLVRLSYILHPEPIQKYSKNIHLDIYKKKLTFPMRLWSFFGPSTHYTAIIILILLNRLDFMTDLFLIYSNIALLAAIIIQNIQYRSFARAVSR